VEYSVLSGQLPGAQPVFMTAWTGDNHRAAPAARPSEAQERCHVQVTDPADQVREWGIQHEITRDVLISLMGGSP
jgi:hypothetical protein